MQQIEEMRDNVLSGKTERFRTLNATSDCPFTTCDGSGWIHREDTHYHFLPPEEKRKTFHIQYLECDCHEVRQEKRKLEQTLKQAQIPEKFLDAGIKNFDLTKYQLDESRSAAAYAKRMAANFVEKFENIKSTGKGIYFYSRKKGSGKTRLAISIGNALLKKHGVVPLYTSATNIFSEIQSTFESDKSTVQVKEAFMKAKVLIIDDMGVEKSSGSKKGSSNWNERTMNDILEYRMNNNLITFFTANLPISELTSPTLYPEGRVQSRVNKMAYELHMPEESVRDREAEEENYQFEQYLLE
ncbi:ATP-binding protein [Bacillus suaedae]